MKGTVTQHIVNAVQILFGGLLIFLIIGNPTLLEDYSPFRNKNYVLLLLAVVFAICIIIKGQLKKRYQIKDPLVQSKVARWLIFISYGIFAVFIFVLTEGASYMMLIGGLAWSLQIIALVISFFYSERGIENDEVLDDQMISDDV